MLGEAALRCSVLKSGRSSQTSSAELQGLLSGTGCSIHPLPCPPRRLRIDAWSRGCAGHTSMPALRLVVEAVALSCDIGAA